MRGHATSLGQMAQAISSHSRGSKTRRSPTIPTHVFLFCHLCCLLFGLLTCRGCPQSKIMQGINTYVRRSVDCRSHHSKPTDCALERHPCTCLQVLLHVQAAAEGFKGDRTSVTPLRKGRAGMAGSTLLPPVPALPVPAYRAQPQ